MGDDDSHKGVAFEPVVRIVIICAMKNERQRQQTYNLERFVEAQDRMYRAALNEIRAGRKVSHWIWFVFPQLKELGFSSTARYYGIADLAEAQAYLAHPLLRARLIEISQALLALDDSDPSSVMGYPDDLKLRSSMTLFEAADPATDVFAQVLEKFYAGKRDEKTLAFLGIGSPKHH